MPLETVSDGDLLYRRLAPGWIKPDGSVASVAFMSNGKPDNEISVDLARLTTAQNALSGKPQFGLGQIVARVPRTLGFEVFHDPQLDNYAHSLVTGENSKPKCKNLAEQTAVLVLPRQLS